MDNKLAQEAISKDDVQGIGIGVPGPVDSQGVVHRCVNLGWGVVNVAEELGNLTGLTIKVGNDANVAALGEMWQGGAKGSKDVIMVTLGTGVGGGIIVDGKVVAGFNGAGGEIVATALQLWNKTKSDLTLAQTTYNRILTLYKDSVITSQRKDEVEAMYKAAVAAERAAYEQYQMAVDGAQKEDKASAASMVDAARSTVDEVSALLVDARLTAPENGQIATIFPKRGELVAPGTPIMNLVVIEIDESV